MPFIDLEKKIETFSELQFGFSQVMKCSKSTSGFLIYMNSATGMTAPMFMLPVVKTNLIRTKDGRALINYAFDNIVGKTKEIVEEKKLNVKKNLNMINDEVPNIVKKSIEITDKTDIKDVVKHYPKTCKRIITSKEGTESFWLELDLTLKKDQKRSMAEIWMHKLDPISNDYVKDFLLTDENFDEFTKTDYNISIVVKFPYIYIGKEKTQGEGCKLAVQALHVLVVPTTSIDIHNEMLKELNKVSGLTPTVKEEIIVSGLTPTVKEEIIVSEEKETNELLEKLDIGSRVVIDE